jgi:hypothetical protein
VQTRLNFIALEFAGQRFFQSFFCFGHGQNLDQVGRGGRHGLAEVAHSVLGGSRRLGRRRQPTVGGGELF